MIRTWKWYQTSISLKITFSSEFLGHIKRENMKCWRLEWDWDFYLLKVYHIETQAIYIKGLLFSLYCRKLLYPFLIHIADLSSAPVMCFQPQRAVYLKILNDRCVGNFYCLFFSYNQFTKKQISFFHKQITNRCV